MRRPNATHCDDGSVRARHLLDKARYFLKVVWQDDSFFRDDALFAHLSARVSCVEIKDLGTQHLVPDSDKADVRAPLPGSWRARLFGNLPIRALKVRLIVLEHQSVRRAVRAIRPQQRRVLLGVKAAPKRCVAIVVQFAVREAELDQEPPDVLVVPREDGMHSHEGRPALGGRGETLDELPVRIALPRAKQERLRPELVLHVLASVLVAPLVALQGQAVLPLHRRHKLVHLREALVVNEVGALYRQPPSATALLAVLGLERGDRCPGQVQHYRRILAAIEAQHQPIDAVEPERPVQNVQRLAVCTIVVSGRGDPLVQLEIPRCRHGF
mmetsp:Transcript_22015/g.54268  ORF Transcript_22015/g.54268 Transcript_22015/m.54268 type:complete len:327 (+) Transcript_22015:776-1756(+)